MTTGGRWGIEGSMFGYNGCTASFHVCAYADPHMVYVCAFFVFCMIVHRSYIILLCPHILNKGRSPWYL